MYSVFLVVILHVGEVCRNARAVAGSATSACSQSCVSLRHVSPIATSTARVRARGTVVIVAPLQSRDKPQNRVNSCNQPPFASTEMGGKGTRAGEARANSSPNSYSKETFGFVHVLKSCFLEFVTHCHISPLFWKKC